MDYLSQENTKLNLKEEQIVPSDEGNDFLFKTKLPLPDNIFKIIYNFETNSSENISSECIDEPKKVNKNVGISKSKKNYKIILTLEDGVLKSRKSFYSLSEFMEKDGN